MADDLLVITGDNFGSTGSVTVGSKNCPVLSYTDTVISCALPIGEGAVVPVTVSNPSQSSPCVTTTGPWTPLTPLEPSACTTSYPAPQLRSISPTHGGVIGGYPLTVTGSGFGTGNYTAVTVAGRGCRVLSSTTTVIRCVVPAGVGRLVQVQVVVARQSSNTLSFAYDPPQFVGITPTVMDALLGGTVNLYGGVNFGGNDEQSKTVPYSWRITVGGLPCAPVLHFDDNRMLCTFQANVPVGDREVVVHVSDQNSTAAMPVPVLLSSVCMPGSYGAVGQRCTRCADGGVCPGGDKLPLAALGCVATARFAWTALVAS
jgi:hypothetical protein